MHEEQDADVEDSEDAVKLSTSLTPIYPIIRLEGSRKEALLVKHIMTQPHKQHTTRQPHTLNPFTL